jgi:hypothetical protein
MEMIMAIRIINDYTALTGLSVRHSDHCVWPAPFCIAASCKLSRFSTIVSTMCRPGAGLSSLHVLSHSNLSSWSSCLAHLQMRKRAISRGAGTLAPEYQGLTSALLPLPADWFILHPSSSPPNLQKTVPLPPSYLISMTEVIWSDLALLPEQLPHLFVSLPLPPPALPRWLGICFLIRAALSLGFGRQWVEVASALIR